MASTSKNSPNESRFHRWHENNRWVGPLVFLSSSIFFLGQIVVAWTFRGSPLGASTPQKYKMYNLISNTISDLGNSACGTYHNGYVCSPHWALMDAVFFLVGGCMMLGSVLLYHEFCDRDATTTPFSFAGRTIRRPKEKTFAKMGFTCMGLGGLGVLIISLFPENTIGYMHEGGAALGIGVGNLGILVLGASLGLPESMRRNMIIFSSFSITALILFASQKSFGLGGGTMERLATYPEVVWMIGFGLYVWQNHPKSHYGLHREAKRAGSPLCCPEAVTW